MSAYVITLIADPEIEKLTTRMARNVATALGANVTDIEWIEPDIACDIYFTLRPMEEIQSVNPFYLLRQGLRSLMEPQAPKFESRRWELLRSVRQVLSDVPIDAIIQPVAYRQKKLLICDMDSTMITVECVDELADFVGKKREVSAITERAMNGELDFAAALTERVALLEGLPVETMEQCYRERVVMSTGAKTLVHTLKSQGCHCMLVSGGFTFFTNRVRDELGFHEDRANTLEVDGDRLTGRVVPPILGKEAKLTAMEQACERRGISTDEVLAIGDGANDLPMLLASGLGIAYRAKPRVQEAAHARLNYNDLSTILFALGIGREQWITS